MSNDVYLTESFKYITPNFMQHANVRDESDSDILFTKLKFIFLNLGFQVVEGTLVAPSTEQLYGYSKKPQFKIQCKMGEDHVHKYQYYKNEVKDEDSKAEIGE